MPTCKYCTKEFVKESTLSHHVCEPKRRYLAKDEKHSVIGFQTYVRFYQLTSGCEKLKSFDEFAKSPYYNAFIKFGSFVNNIHPLYPSNYIDWIIKSNTKLDHWCKDELYEKYVVELIFNESVTTALERSILHMQDWADEFKEPWNDYFRKVSPNRGVYDIKDGKISPWLLLNCKSGTTFVAGLNDEQLSDMSGILKAPIWMKKFKDNPDDIKLIRNIASTGGL